MLWIRLFSKKTFKLEILAYPFLVSRCKLFSRVAQRPTEMEKSIKIALTQLRAWKLSHKICAKNAKKKQKYQKMPSALWAPQRLTKTLCLDERTYFMSCTILQWGHPRPEKIDKITHAKIQDWKISTQNICKKWQKLCKNGQNCTKKA